MADKRRTIRAPRPGKVHSQDYKVVKIRTERNGLGALRTLLIAGLIAIQAAVLVCLYIFLSLAFRWYLIVSFALSLITCVYVLSSSRNGLSKAVWILFLLLAFSFGYLLYFLSDERIFFRRARRRYREVFARAQGYLPARREPAASLPVRRDARFLYEAGKFAAYEDTAVRYFPSGAQLFDDVLERLEGAEKFIFIEYFIVADGVLLERMFDILGEKAQNGVDVRLIYDDMGSHGTLTGKMKRRMRDAGIRLQPFNRLIPRFSVALNFRDHRKIVVIDGKTAYSGGSNLADEYINEKRMHGYWKDTGIRLDGPAADAFTLFFLRQWDFLTGAREEYAPFLGRAEPRAGCGTVIPYADGLDFPLPVGKNVYENIIASAQEKIYIMTPYFIPDEVVTQLLASKARAGVDVRIVLPGIPDKALVYSVSRNNAEKLIDAGVKVYCMKDSFVHSKLLLSEHCAVVGSVNFDLRSFYQQLECAVYTDDPSLREAVQSDFAETFSLSERIAEGTRRRKNVFNRIAAGVLQLFAPLM